MNGLCSISPLDIIIDYLWGRPIELLLEALCALPAAKGTKIVTVGSMAGKSILLSSDNLRRNIVLLGSGIGSFTQQVIVDYMRKELPEIFRYAASGKIVMDNEIYPLKAISEAWKLNRGVVITI